MALRLPLPAKSRRSQFRATPIGRWLWVVLCLLIVIFTTSKKASSRLPQPQDEPIEVQKIEPNRQVERSLTPPQSHYYKISLAKGQFLQITASSEQLWLSLDVRFGEPKPVAGDGGFAPPSKAIISLIAPETGEYRINIGANGKTLPGNYKLLVELPQQATSEFLARARAQELLTGLSTLYYDQRNKAAFLKMTETGEEAANLFGQLGMFKAQADALNLVVEAWRQLGELAKALETSERTLRLSREIGYHGRAAEVLTFMGMCRYQLSDYHHAIEAFRGALPVWEVLQATGNQVFNMSGWTLTQLGQAHLALGELRPARDAFEQAMQFYQRYNNLSGGIGNNAKEWHTGTAFALRGIGRIHSLTGEKQAALDTLNAAIEHYKGAGDTYYTPLLLNETGEVYASLGERGQALALYEEALQLEQRMGSRATEAQTLYLIGQLHQAAANEPDGGLNGAVGELDKAETQFRQALDIRRGLGERRGTAAALNSLGEVQAKRGEARRALPAFEEALGIQREIGDRYGEGITLNNLGVAFAALGETARARELLQQALALRRTLGDRDGEAQTLYQLARLTANTGGQLSEARTLLEAALQLTEQIRAGVLSQELRASYLGAVGDYYEFYTELLMRLHERAPQAEQQFPRHQIDALRAAEMARARSLLELLAEAQVDIRTGAPPALLARERELRQRLSAKADFQLRLQTGLLPAGPHTPEQRATLARELQTLNTEHQEVRARLRTASPRYAALTQPQPLTAAAIQQLLDDETVLLEYALGAERSFLWLVTRERVTSYVLPPRTEINAAARRVHVALTARNRFIPDEPAAQRRARIAQADAEFPEAAQALSRLVLAPVANQLGQKRLLIVAQEALQFVPFAVLPIPWDENERVRGKNRRALPPSSMRPRPLIAEHEIVHLPSASTLAMLRMEHPQRQTNLKEVAVLADPVFSAEDTRLTAAARLNNTDGSAALSKPERLYGLQHALRDFGAADTAGLRVNRLLGTRWEAEQITARVAPQQQMRALDFAANRALATGAALNQYRIVHFATHALINTTHPALSGIVLSLVDEQGRSQDGFLPAAEIFNLNFSARLVVLSACQTGLGKTVRGEGLVGMVQSFLYAGASSVAVSLWSQQDGATAELMSQFYRRLLGKQRLTPAAALRAAQLEMLKSGRWPSPYFWAGFTLQGDWR